MRRMPTPGNISTRCPGGPPWRLNVREALSTADAFLLLAALSRRAAVRHEGPAPKEQPILVTLPSPNDPDYARVIPHPSSLDAKGGTAIDFDVPSRNGKYVAISLSKGGSESGDVHVYDTGTRQATDAVVPRVNGGTAGGKVAGNEAGDGFYYSRYPRHGERPAADMDFYQQVCFHKLGTKTEQDTYSIGKEFPPDRRDPTRGERRRALYPLALANGDGGEFEHYLRVPRGNGRRSRDWPMRCRRSLGQAGNFFCCRGTGAEARFCESIHEPMAEAGGHRGAGERRSHPRIRSGCDDTST